MSASAVSLLRALLSAIYTRSHMILKAAISQEVPGGCHGWGAVIARDHANFAASAEEVVKALG